MLPLHPDHMLKMFHTEQKELLFVVGRRPLYGTPGKLNRVRTKKVHGGRTTKGNRIHPTKRILWGDSRTHSGTAPASYIAGPECCTA